MFHRHETTSQATSEPFRSARRWRRFAALLTAAILMASLTPAWHAPAQAQSAITVAIDSGTTYQTIDGFGTCVSGVEAQQPWWQQLYYDDLSASILRVDLTPRLVSPYSDFTYNSPWFHNSPALPGPEGNNVRTYTGPGDYSRSYAGRNAPIAVMKADANQNIAFFDYNQDMPKTGGAAAQAGQSRAAQLGDFKLVGSIWSPLPWVKVSSGNRIQGQSGIMPANGTPWPFIWYDNFAGGKLDVSGTPLSVFYDGTQNTSALTQFARSTAAYILGYQRSYNVRFYAISIQNELNFEQFYNSAYYPLSSQYITALKAVRAEFDKYPELRDIRIMGPEDLMGNDAYGMWEYGGPIHKNLQLLQNIQADPAAASAISFFNIHGYAGDGVSSPGATPQLWNWWANGWATSPAAGIPSNVKGFTAYNKKSWMTETSGEESSWLGSGTGFPGNSAWSIALKIHQALTTGRESAWIYWQLTDGSAVKGETLTDSTLRANSPKYVALKHFARYIRPNAVRVAANVSGSSTVNASAYVHNANKSLTLVLVNSSSSSQTMTVQLPASPAGISSLQSFTSSNNSLWQSSTVSVSSNRATVTVPGYGVTTLYGVGSSGGSGTGLRGEYFNNTTLTAPAALTRTDAQVNFDWASGSPATGVTADNFSVRWTGQVEAPVSGAYTFATTSDDGVRLWVNGQQLVNNWTDHPPTTDSGPAITLTAGQKYSITMEYYERGGGAVARLLWSYPGQAQQAIPQSRLFPATGSTGSKALDASTTSFFDVPAADGQHGGIDIGQ
jgi:O-glycosyl hydrolase